MKTSNRWFAIFATAALFLNFVPRNADASPGVSFQFFYDSLDPYGEWFDVPEYGYCWRPSGVDSDWTPYTDGYWAYTDAGWTWVSYEDFGGVTYHYGRWLDLESEGWVWVPDYEWAPAWVSWRSSDDYVGWAPLPPRARFHHDIGFSIWVDSEFDIGPGYYNFCEVRNFGAPALRPFIVDRRRNVTFINQTVNITNISVNKSNNVIFNGGPNYQAIQKRSLKPIQTLKLVRQTDPNAVKLAGGRTLSKQQGGQLVVVAPDVAPPTDKLQSRPARIAKVVDQPKINTGWGDTGDAKMKKQVEEKFKRDAKGMTPQNAPAKPPTENEMKIVEETVKAGSKHPTQPPPIQPETLTTSQPGGQPASTSPTPQAKGQKNKQGELQGLTTPTPALTTQPSPGQFQTPPSTTGEVTPPQRGKHGTKPSDTLMQPFVTPQTQPGAEPSTNTPPPVATPKLKKNQPPVSQEMTTPPPAENFQLQQQRIQKERDAAAQAEQLRQQKLMENQRKQQADVEQAKQRQLQQQQERQQQRLQQNSDQQTRQLQQQQQQEQQRSLQLQQERQTIQQQPVERQQRQIEQVQPKSRQQFQQQPQQTIQQQPSPQQSGDSKKGKKKTKDEENQ